MTSSVSEQDAPPVVELTPRQRFIQIIAQRPEYFRGWAAYFEAGVYSFVDILPTMLRAPARHIVARILPDADVDRAAALVAFLETTSDEDFDRYGWELYSLLRAVYEEPHE